MQKKIVTLALIALGCSLAGAAQAGDGCGYYPYRYGCARPRIVRIYPRYRSHCGGYYNFGTVVERRSAPAIPQASGVPTEPIQNRIPANGPIDSQENVVSSQPHASHNHAAHNHVESAPTPDNSEPASPSDKGGLYGGQKTCPVLGDELGAMGTPIPVQVKGQTIYVCCNGCLKKVKKDPDKYVKKVEAERAGRS